MDEFFELLRGRNFVERPPILAPCGGMERLAQPLDIELVPFAHSIPFLPVAGGAARDRFWRTNVIGLCQLQAARFLIGARFPRHVEYLVFRAQVELGMAMAFQ